MISWMMFDLLDGVEVNISICIRHGECCSGSFKASRMQKLSRHCLCRFEKKYFSNETSKTEQKKIDFNVNFDFGKS